MGNLENSEANISAQLATESREICQTYFLLMSHASKSKHGWQWCILKMTSSVFPSFLYPHCFKNTCLVVQLILTI